MSSSKVSTQIIAKRVLVSGKVQGVGFRFALADKARSAHIQGWCRNLPTGQVECLMQGEASKLNALLDWLQQGPPGAIVENVTIEDQAVLEPMLGESIQAFEIRK